MMAIVMDVKLTLLIEKKKLIQMRIIIYCYDNIIRV